MSIKSIKMTISKSKKQYVFLSHVPSIIQSIPRPKVKVCHVDCVPTDTHTDTKLTTEGTLSEFQDFSFNLSSMIGPKL